MKSLFLKSFSVSLLFISPFAGAEWKNQGYVSPEYQNSGPRGGSGYMGGQMLCLCVDESGRPYAPIGGTDCVPISTPGASVSRTYDCVRGGR